ncbi:MAG: hypothetical protein LBV09_01185 [Deferribacteraceae bacterium]|nr:hypothetical protein [Deferribacteraceae bacterium]
MQKKFKLQKVLDYRNLVLEREKAQLAELVMQEQRIIEEVRDATAMIQQKQQEMAEAQDKGDFNIAQLYPKYILRLEADRNKLQLKLAEHRQTMYKQKGKTVVAFKRKTVMDKLQTKHKEAYRTFVDKEEAKTTEDIVLTRKAAQMVNAEE